MASLLRRLLHMVVVSAREEPRKVNGLLQSLQTATLTEVEWSGRYSHSGATFFVKEVRARLETGKHIHELNCHVVGRNLYCDWKVDGKDVGTVELSPRDELYQELMRTIDFALRMEKVEENKVILRERPLVEPQSKILWPPWAFW